MQKIENEWIEKMLKCGYKVGRRDADELYEVAIGRSSAAESSLEIEVLVVLLRVTAQLIGHEVDAFAVQEVVERHAGVFADALHQINAVGANGAAYGLDGRIGIAPFLAVVHQLAEAWPIVPCVGHHVLLFPVVANTGGCLHVVQVILLVLAGWGQKPVAEFMVGQVTHHKGAPQQV